jgi:hypothetical protein
VLLYRAFETSGQESVVTMEAVYAVNAVGIQIGNPESAPRTYIIAGTERGGTSPVAGVARALGLYLGENLDRNSEDPAFAARDYESTLNAIATRDFGHVVWGWKYPKALLDLPLYVDHLRSPHLVVVLRDPIASAMGHEKWSGPGIKKPLAFHLSEAQALNSLNVTHVLASRFPSLLISYEKWLACPSDGIDVIAAFLGAPRPDRRHRAKILAYLRGSYYKDYEHFFPN